VPGSESSKRGTFKVESGQSPVRLVWASPARTCRSLGLVDIPEAVTRELYSGHLTPRTANWALRLYQNAVRNMIL